MFDKTVQVVFTLSNIEFLVFRSAKAKLLVIKEDKAVHLMGTTMQNEHPQPLH